MKITFLYILLKCYILYKIYIVKINIYIIYIIKIYYKHKNK